MTQFQHDLIATFLGMVSGYIIHKYFTVPGEREYWEDFWDRIFSKF